MRARAIVENRDYYASLGLRLGAFFDAETYGKDQLIVGMQDVPMRELLRHAQLSVRTKNDIARVEEGAADYMPGVNGAEKKERLSRMSYRDFLRDLVKVDEPTLAFYQPITNAEFAVGIDAVWHWILGIRTAGLDG
jgi:spermidine dehydrogenase